MSRRIRLLTLTVMALAALALSAAQAARSKEFNQTADLETGGRLRVCTYKGTIELIPWDKPLVEVHARIEAPADVSDAYAKKSIAATRVVMTGGRGSVTVEVDYDDVPAERGWFGFESSKILPYAHLKVHAPRRVNLVIEDYKSDLTLDGFEGKLRIKTYKGTVRGHDLSGELIMDTYKGDATFARQDGRVEAETYKGRIDIEADRLEGRCRLETYKGDIRLQLNSRQPVTVIADISAKGTLVDRLGRAAEAAPGRQAETDGPGAVRLSVETYKGQIRLER